MWGIRVITTTSHWQTQKASKGAVKKVKTRFIKFLYHETLSVVLLWETGSRVPAISARGLSLLRLMYPRSQKTRLWWLLIVFPKHIYPHTPTAVHNSAAGSVLLGLSMTNACEQLCRKKKSPASWKWKWRVQMFKDVIRAFVPFTETLVTPGWCRVPHWNFHHKAGLTRSHYIQ